MLFAPALDLQNAPIAVAISKEKFFVAPPMPSFPFAEIAMGNLS